MMRLEHTKAFLAWLVCAFLAGMAFGKPAQCQVLGGTGGQPTSTASSPTFAGLTLNGPMMNTGYSYQTPSTGFSITIGNSTGMLLLDPAGLLATGTVTMPAAPADGQFAFLLSSQVVTALTVSPNGGQSIKGPLTTIAANGAAAWIYRAANSTWYRLQ